MTTPITQSVLLHNDTLGYGLPALDFVSPSQEPNKNTQRRKSKDIYTLRKRACVQDR